MLSNRIIDFVTRYVPWLAPIPTATAIFRAGMQHLGWPWPVALAAAALVEGLGMATAELALDLRSYNRDRSPGSAAAPTWLAVLTAVFYLFTAVLLAVLIDVIPGLARWVVAIFPFLGLTGYVTLALRRDHDRRLARVQEQRALALDYERKERELKLENKRLDAEARRQLRLLKASNPAGSPTGQPAPAGNSQFACRHCQQAFGSVQAVNAHMRAHAGKNGNAETVSAETLDDDTY